MHIICLLGQNCLSTQASLSRQCMVWFFIFSTSKFLNLQFLHKIWACQAPFSQKKSYLNCQGGVTAMCFVHSNGYMNPTKKHPKYPGTTSHQAKHIHPQVYFDCIPKGSYHGPDLKGHFFKKKSKTKKLKKIGI